MEISVMTNEQLKTSGIYDAAFKYAGIDRLKFKTAVNNLIKSSKTTRDKIVSEFLYFYVAPKGSKIMQVNLKGSTALHYFVEWPNETVIDLLLEDYDFSKIDYTKAKKTKLPKGPSAEAMHLAELLGYSEDDLDILLDE